MVSVSTELLSHATCPNCWKDFSTDQIKWVASHEELYSDIRLGASFPQRFLPSRFDASGNALDIKGIPCHELACPFCHLPVPRSLLFYKPFFLSIAGTPACGKSFYLASAIWQLRKSLPELFRITMSDSDVGLNQILNDYEEQLFFNRSESHLATLAKTGKAGDWYSTVQFDDQTMTFPKPFYFDLKPGSQHFNQEAERSISRLLCLYDNAGELFEPGEDTAIRPITRHLGLAESWLFCFDPSQDPRIRDALKGLTNDYQMTEPPVTARQEKILNEMINRIRKHSGMGFKDRSQKPLIIVCTKFDAWSKLMGELPVPWSFSKKRQIHGINLDVIQEVSRELRTVIGRYCPEFLAATEALSDNVYFVPVSATGSAPQLGPDGKTYLVNTEKIDPIWCEVPVLLALGHRAPGLIRAFQKADQSGKD